ncbi:peptidoglycan-binding protein [Bacillus sp. AFS017336]|uniref:peptidoglycan-binding protein n=1 Tax=Bacillus sp. AFS017336 TaxID=2033489 RepID=UPI0015CF37FE|nr:peptidoglycan-binding protein [Bacillus sp. AFS017336]
MVDVTKTCRDINELLPAAQKAVKLFLDECKKAELDIFITETYRSQARQDYLYSYGRTREGEKVTWTRSSNHTCRLAWDIAVNKPKDLYDSPTLKKAGEIAKGLGITWGGTWKQADFPHFEVKKDWVPPKTSKPDTSIKAEFIEKDIVPYPGKPLKVGSKGKDVERIQRALKVNVDGKFGIATEEAVKAYQKRKGLTVDGLVGQQTWSKLF